MKNIKKFPLAFCVLLGSSNFMPQAHARMHHLWFDDSSFFDTSWVDSMMDLREQSMNLMKEHMEQFGPSKEDKESFKAAQKLLSSVKPEITETDHKVTIKLSGFENLDKKDIKIVKRKNGWDGVITVKNGTVEFFIAKNGIKIVRRIELKNEEKNDKKGSFFYTGSLAAESESFKAPINLQTVKAEAIKDNTLVITAEQEKEELLSIP